MARDVSASSIRALGRIASLFRRSKEFTAGSSVLLAALSPSPRRILHAMPSRWCVRVLSVLRVEQTAPLRAALLHESTTPAPCRIQRRPSQWLRDKTRPARHRLLRSARRIPNGSSPLRLPVGSLPVCLQPVFLQAPLEARVLRGCAGDRPSLQWSWLRWRLIRRSILLSGP